MDKFGINKVENKICNVIGDFGFKKKENGYEIDRYSGNSKEIIINEKYNEIPIIGIGDEIFHYSGLMSVTIPESVTYIGDRAFHANNLSEISIPKLVSHIGDMAFSNNELTSLIIPESVKAIGNNAFKNNKLTQVVIPESVTYIGEFAFHKNQIKGIIIPDSITRIYNDSFSNNLLTGVVIPDSVTHIMWNAFKNNKLTGIIIPDSVTCLGEECFSDNNLKYVILGNSVTDIGNSAFKNNPDLKICCKKGSYAEKYSKKNNIPCLYLDTDETSSSLVKKPDVNIPEKNQIESYFLNLISETENGLFKQIYFENADYVKNDSKIDLQFKNHKTDKIFAIICRHRSNLVDGNINWASNHSANKYRRFEQNNDISVFIALGLGGTHEEPEYIYLMPLKEVENSILNPLFLKDYEIRNEKDISKILNL